MEEFFEPSAVPRGTFKSVWFCVAIGFVLVFGAWAVWELLKQAGALPSSCSSCGGGAQSAANSDWDPHEPISGDHREQMRGPEGGCGDGGMCSTPLGRWYPRSASDPSAELDWVGGPVQAP